MPEKAFSYYKKVTDAQATLTCSSVTADDSYCLRFVSIKIYKLGVKGFTASVYFIIQSISEFSNEIDVPMLTNYYCYAKVDGQVSII